MCQVWLKFWKLLVSFQMIILFFLSFPVSLVFPFWIGPLGIHNVVEFLSNFYRNTMNKVYISRWIPPPFSDSWSLGLLYYLVSGFAWNFCNAVRKTTKVPTRIPVWGISTPRTLITQRVFKSDQFMHTVKKLRPSSIPLSL